MQRRNKFGNKPTVIDGIRFASQAEGNHYIGHKAAGFPDGFRCQPRFPLVVNGKTVATVVPDFYYRENGREVVEDVKSKITAKHPVYRLKKKLFEALYPTIEFREVMS